ncbi:MAG: hypothetical protein JNM28_01580 [Armatimonadetes bacterium]|nr:hypothetical protein [Armatimonadota bacterium]
MVTAALALGMVRADFDWTLTCERTEYAETGRYAEALAFCDQLRLQPNTHVFPIGKSPEGREMLVVVVSTDSNVLLPKERKKPLLFINNGIHSGEIEGKDADLILARRLLHPDGAPDEPFWGDLLDKASFAFIPVLSVDAHERMSPFNRANQNGPREMGWRVTGQNINLNRDWGKLDALEMRNLVDFVNDLAPDFYVDNHTTDGGDWQYTVQYDVPRNPTMDDRVVAVSQNFVDDVMPKLDKAGFLTAPYFGGFDERHPERGLTVGTFGIRYSTGYWAARNRPSMLVETHVLKPYRDRVMATLEANRLTLEWVGKHGQALMEAGRMADMLGQAVEEGDDIVLTARNSGKTRPFTFRGFKFAPYQSEVSGGEIPHWTKEKVDTPTVIRDQYEPGLTVKAPAGWLVPAPMTDVIERLALHKIVMVPARPGRVELTAYRFENVALGTETFEGRTMPRYKVVEVRRTVDVPEGSVIVPVGQPLVRLAAQLLEPQSGESFANWGFFNNFFEQKEYAEAYAMEPVAKKMLEDPAVKAAFEEALKDPQFAANPSARLDWFFQRSPFYDSRLLIQPVYRLTGDQFSSLKVEKN